MEQSISSVRPQSWRYTVMPPGPEWQSAGFDDRGWPSGPAPFGPLDEGRAKASSFLKGDDPDIWLRKEFELPPGPWREFHLLVLYDESFEASVDGMPVASGAGGTGRYKAFGISPSAAAALRPGKNILAIHGQSGRKGSILDAGLFLGSPASPALPPRAVFLAETLLRDLRFAEAARLLEEASQDLASEDRPAELLDSLRVLIKGSR